MSVIKSFSCLVSSQYSYFIIADRISNEIEKTYLSKHNNIFMVIRNCLKSCFVVGFIDVLVTIYLNKPRCWWTYGHVDWTILNIIPTLHAEFRKPVDNTQTGWSMIYYNMETIDTYSTIRLNYDYRPTRD